MDYSYINHNDDEDDLDADDAELVRVTGEQQQQQQQKATTTAAATATSYGVLDTSQIKNECWLIRIPPKLAELLEMVHEEGVELGELIFTKGGTKADGTVVKPALTVHIAEDLIENIATGSTATAAAAAAAAAAASVTGSTVITSSTSSNSHKKASMNLLSTLPLHYSLQAMTKKIPVMYPFSRHPITGSCRLLGTIARTGNLQVYQQDSNYRNQLKQRIITSNINGQRFVKPVDVTESILAKQQRTTAMIPSSSSMISGGNTSKNSFGNAVYQYGKQLQEQSQESSLLSHVVGNNNNNSLGPSAKKRARQFAPDQSLRSVLFELFEQQPYWTIKELRAAAIYGGCHAASAKRAETEIRDILRTEIGEYHRSGDHKNKWELRKEFQQQQQQQQPKK